MTIGPRPDRERSRNDWQSIKEHQKSSIDQGSISSSVLSVFFTDNCYKLLKSLHLIGWEQICQWKTLTKRLMKCPPVWSVKGIWCCSVYQNALTTGRRQLTTFRKPISDCWQPIAEQTLSAVVERSATGLYVCVTMPILAVCYCYTYAKVHIYS